MIYYDYTNVKNEDNTNEKNNSGESESTTNITEAKQWPSSQSQKTHLLPQNRMPGRVKRTQKPNALKPQK